MGNKTPELIVLVGPQGSGKTYVAKNNYGSHTRISQDDQGKGGHVIEFNKALERREDIVVDRINHTRTQRRRYIEPAKELGYRTKIVVNNKPYAECFLAAKHRTDHPTLKSEDDIKRAISHYFSFYQYVTNNEADFVFRMGYFDPYFLDLTRKHRKILAVGDVHGCGDELEEMISTFTENHSGATLLLGDVIDRGPKVKKAIKTAMTGHHYMLMGNHENKLLRYLRGNNVKIGHGLQDTIDQLDLHDVNTPEAQSLRMWLEDQPYLVKFHDNYFVHAGVRHDCDLLKQSNECLIYSRNTWGTNNDDNWYDEYPKEAPNIFFGHNIHDNEIEVKPNVFAMDGGCVFGGELRGAIITPEGPKDFIKIKPKEVYYDYSDASEVLPETLEQYEKLVAEGFLRRRVNEDLVLYNYTDKCTYERHWNEFTLNSRGIVFEKNTGELIARPFPKFFNVGETEETKFENLPKEPYEVFDKADGSLGILYYHHSKKMWRINTRGSFSSDQAIKANEMLTRYDVSKLHTAYTYMLEIIYPENKIIVDYGDLEELRLLGVIHTKSGIEDAHDWLKMTSDLTGFPLVSSFNTTIEQALEDRKKWPTNKEGYVVKFENGLRVKIKGEEYLALAKIMNHMSPLSFWENMERGKVSEKFMEKVPEEFSDEASLYKADLERKYFEIGIQIASDSISAIGPQNKNFDPAKPIDVQWKQVANFVFKESGFEHPDSVMCFLRGKTHYIDEYIMKRIRPKGNVL